jgi:hypothetical protein
MSVDSGRKGTKRMILISLAAALLSAAQPDPAAAAAFGAYQSCLFRYADQAAASRQSRDDFESGLGDRCRQQEEAIRALATAGGRSPSRTDEQATQSLIDRAREDARHRFANPNDESGGGGPDQ